MHHYCVIVAKNAEAERQLPDRLERFVSERPAAWVGELLSILRAALSEYALFTRAT